MQRYVQSQTSMPSRECQQIISLTARVRVFSGQWLNSICQLNVHLTGNGFFISRFVMNTSVRKFRKSIHDFLKCSYRHATRSNIIINLWVQHALCVIVLHKLVLLFQLTFIRCLVLIFKRILRVALGGVAKRKSDAIGPKLFHVASPKIFLFPFSFEIFAKVVQFLKLSQ